MPVCTRWDRWLTSILRRTGTPSAYRKPSTSISSRTPPSVLDCTRTDDTFDARFSATRRHYVYRILCRRSRPVLDANRVWWIARKLDASAMADAALELVGHHDFTTFRAAQCQAHSPEKTVEAFDVSREGSEIVLRVSARSFLHNQVRSMTGSLKLVGEGKWRPRDLRDALAARNRTRCGPVAPASGLYLSHVEYGLQSSSDFDEAEDNEG